MNTSTPHAFALFSGGLDSILAARLIMEQGLVVRCLHFVTPFFGKPQLIPHWEKVYGLEVEAVDVGEAFVRLLRERPAHGFGKVMNPCVDCKILMMRKARELMKKWGASFLISGEVLGQRPMSQRRDTLNVIRRDAEVKESLLRPLSAQLLDPRQRPDMSLGICTYGTVLRVHLKNLLEVGHIVVDVVLQIDNNALICVAQQVTVAEICRKDKIRQSAGVGHIQGDFIAPLVSLNSRPVDMYI